MIANGAREKLLRSHDCVDAAWADFCKAEAALSAAQQEYKTAKDAYEARLKGWDLMVKLCTPGPSAVKPKDGT